MSIDPKRSVENDREGETAVIAFVKTFLGLLGKGRCQGVKAEFLRRIHAAARCRMGCRSITYSSPLI